MGLIKTAIIAGAGIYAVNKISKRSENRRNNADASGANRNYEPQYADGPDSKGYSYYDQPNQRYDRQQQQQQQQPQQQGWSQQGPPPMEFVDRRDPQHQGQPMYLANNPYAPLPHDYRGSAQSQFSMGGSPPQYAYRSGPERGYGTQYKHGFVEAEEVSTNASEYGDEKKARR